jgi:acid phosphatase
MRTPRVALLLLFAAHAPPHSAPTPRFEHVFIVVEENHDYADVIGSPAMPYLNSLASQYGVATQYYANTHPSIGNYFMLTVGDTVTNDDGFSGIVTHDNVVRRLVAARKTWKAYAEDLPSVGYTGDGPGDYARRHNPLSYLSDVVSDSTQRRHLVPFSQFAIDLANKTLPNYAFIVPNVCHDAHSCALDSADQWLRTNIAPLIANRDFQHHGLLIITFDEAGSDTTKGGGRIVWVAVSGKTKRRYQSATPFQHESTLRLTAEALGLTKPPGAAAAAPSMAEFFVEPRGN